jgi:hypothetical protein
MITSAQEFLALMRSDKEDDYHRLRHEEAPMEVWEELLSVYPLANEWVVRNKTSPVEILRKLAKDPRAVVRAEVAMTRRITEDMQNDLVSDLDASVRCALANNSRVSNGVLRRLSEDPEGFVKEAALRQSARRGLLGTGDVPDPPSYV